MRAWRAGPETLKSLGSLLGILLLLSSGSDQGGPAAAAPAAAGHEVGGVAAADRASAVGLEIQRFA